MKMMFAIQCHNFQHRMCWQLSSIYEQEEFDADLTIHIASLHNNGKPTTENIRQSFLNLGMNIQLSCFENTAVFAKRGLVRNHQVRHAIENNYDWIYFSDCDNVYPKSFFRLLVDELKTSTATNCLYSHTKNHTDVEETNSIVKCCLDNCYVVDAFAKANKITTIRKHNRKVAAGCMQVCRVSDIVTKAKSRYVNPRKCKDHHLFQKGQKAKSDIQFRRSMGNGTIINLPIQIHLNHYRDKELGLLSSPT